MTIIEDDVFAPWPDSTSVAQALRTALQALPESVQVLAGTLAVAVSTTPGQLLRVHNAVSADRPAADERDLDVLVASPLVEESAGRLRLASPLDVDVAKRLREANRKRFEDLHAAFAEEESLVDGVGSGSEVDGWEVTARLAYYLSAVDQSTSAAVYMSSFDRAPYESRKACRYWLALLSDRFETVSGESSRTSDFFRAFRLYVAHDREAARPILEALAVEEESSDAITAISAHLLALCLDPRSEEGRRMSLLERAVDLSDQNDLPDNLLMARHSLAWMNVTVARRNRANSIRYLESARRMAAANDSLADSLSRPFYQCWTRNAAAVIGWLAKAGLGSVQLNADVETQLNRSLRLLADARNFAERSSDLNSWVIACISEASIYRSAGMYQEAVDALETGVRAAEAARAIAELPIKQFESEVDRLRQESPVEDVVVDDLAVRLRRTLRYRRR